MTLAEEQVPATDPVGVTLADILAEVHSVGVRVDDLALAHRQTHGTLQQMAGLIGTAFEQLDRNLTVIGMQLAELQQLAGRAAPLLDHPAARFGRLFRGGRGPVDEVIVRASSPKD